MFFARILQFLPRLWQAVCVARGRRYSVDCVGPAARNMLKVAGRKSARTRQAVSRTGKQGGDSRQKFAKTPFRVPSCVWSRENQAKFTSWTAKFEAKSSKSEPKIAQVEPKTLSKAIV